MSALEREKIKNKGWKFKFKNKKIFTL